MARKTAEGRYILSAGEIGSFTVCPEAWRLKNLVKVRSSKSESILKGLSLHAEWAVQNDEVLFLAQAIRMILLLILLFILLYVFS